MKNYSYLKTRKLELLGMKKWYFSIVDVVSVLTESADGRKYWNKLKQRMIKEGNELVTNYHQLKLNAIEHTDAGGYVSISVTKSNSLIIIRVEDSGNRITEGIEK